MYSREAEKPMQGGFPPLSLRSTCIPLKDTSVAVSVMVPSRGERGGRQASNLLDEVHVFSGSSWCDLQYCVVQLPGLCSGAIRGDIRSGL